MPYFQSQGELLYYLQQGIIGGQPLIFLHGYRGSGTTHWKRQVSNHYLLQQDLNLFFPDLRGFGRNKIHSVIYTADIVIDLKILIDTIKPLKPILVGYSLGSYIALEYAKNYPEDVAGLILVSGVPFHPRKIKPYRLRKEKIKQNYGHAPKEESALRKAALAWFWGIIKVFWRARWSNYISKIATNYPFMVDRITKIKTPTILFYAAKDTVQRVPPALMIEKLPNLVKIFAYQADHGLQYDHFKKFNKDIVKSVKLIRQKLKELIH